MDHGSRLLWITLRRALLMVVKAIEKVCGKED